MINIKTPQDIGMKQGDKVLFVYPHPDDETIFAGGFVQFLIENGIDVSILILSRGEASTLRYGVKDNEDLGSLREKEFTDVCKILSVRKYKMESFPDGGFQSVEKEMKEHLKTILPNYDVIITFEPEGAYGHLDHKMLSRAITELHDELKSFGLIYTTVKGWYRILGVKPMFPTHSFTLSAEQFKVKTRAFGRYKTQFSFLRRPIRYIMILFFTRREYFCV